MKKAVIGNNAHVWLCTTLMNAHLGFAAALTAFNDNNKEPHK